MTSGIYRIVNLVNGKLYVGSSINLKSRLTAHRDMLNAGTHRNRHLLAAWAKHGESAFSFEVLLICHRDMLIFYEQRAIDVFDAVRSGYNLVATAGSVLGLKHSQETRQKISKAITGRTQSPDHIAKKTATALGKKRSEQACKNLSAGQMGKKMSPEARAKMSARIQSPETIEKIRAAKVGIKHSPETRAKMSAAHKVRLAHLKK